jgi:hypothetical protein
MTGIWTVARWELRLLRRGYALQVSALVVIVLGIWAAAGLREQPWGAWSILAYAAALVTLALAVTTGGQISRDRRYRVEGVVLATPVANAAYVLGKYLAALLALLALAGLSLLAALLMDHFDAWRNPVRIFGQALFPPMGHAIFPALGVWPYLAAWFWLVLTPTIFGAALTLAAVTIAQRRHIAVYALVLLCWLGPVLIGELVLRDRWPDLLDPTALQLAVQHSVSMGAIGLPQLQALGALGPNVPAPVAAQVVHLVQQITPPPFPAIFLWNRLFFLLLTALLLGLTTAQLRRWREGKA